MAQFRDGARRGVLRYICFVAWSDSHRLSREPVLGRDDGRLAQRGHRSVFGVALPPRRGLVRPTRAACAPTLARSGLGYGRRAGGDIFPLTGSDLDGREYAT
jgi:hypothetical protein